MSDTNTREASMPTRTTDWGDDGPRADADDQTADEKTGPEELAPLFAKLAPRPSALGVTYSLI
jgi:hypothetical protein